MCAQDGGEGEGGRSRLLLGQNLELGDLIGDRAEDVGDPCRTVWICLVRFVLEIAPYAPEWCSPPLTWTGEHESDVLQLNSFPRILRCPEGSPLIVHSRNLIVRWCLR